MANNGTKNPLAGQVFECENCNAKWEVEESDRFEVSGFSLYSVYCPVCSTCYCETKRKTPLDHAIEHAIKRHVDNILPDYDPDADY